MIDVAMLEEAERQLAGGDYAAAYDAYRHVMAERIQQLRSSGSFELTDVVVMERLAELAVQFGRAQAASSLLAAIGALFRRAGNVYAADFAEVKLTSISISCGNLSEAEAILQRLEPRVPPLSALDAVPANLQRWERACTWPATSAADRQVLLLALLQQAGRLAAAKGQYRLAIAIFQYAERLCGPETSTHSRQEIAVMLAAVRMERGDLAGATAGLTQLLRQTLPAGIAIRAYTVQAKLQLLEGSLGDACTSLRAVYERSVASGFSLAAASSALNLAGVLIYLNQTAEARRWIARANFGRDEDQSGLLRRSRATLRLAVERGQSLVNAVAIAPSVTELWTDAEAGPNETNEEPFEDASGPVESLLDLLEQRSLTFHWLLGRRDWRSAESLLQQMQDTVRGHDSMLIESRILFLEGLLRYYRGRYEEAQTLLQDAAAAAIELGFDLDLWQTQRVLSWTLERRGQRPEASAQRDASDRLLARITDSLDVTEKAIFRLNKWTAEEESLAAEIDRLLQMQAKSTNLRGWRRFIAGWQLWREAFALQSRIDEYKTFVVRQGLALQTGAPPSAPPWWRIALRMKHDEATLRFVVLPDRVLTLVTTRSSVHAGLLRLSRLALRQQVAEYHRNLRDPDRQALARQTLEELAIALEIASIATLLPTGIKRLTLLADDSLHGLPFAALPCGATTLGDRFVLTRGFEFFPQRAPARAAPRRGFLLALPDGDDELAPLPGALDEAKIFAEWCSKRGQECVPGDADQGASALCRTMEQATDVHIVCHGGFNPREPDLSGLVLTSPNGRLGMLTVRDLARSNLSSVRQIVLSSCWGADNFVLPGRFIISLPETLWRAGAHVIVACLWEVSDDVASPFMQAFYNNLGWMRSDEALAAVQRQCRDNALPNCPLPDTKDPYFWAGFQIYGDTAVHS